MSSGGAKVKVSNLHYNVTEEDLKVLDNEIIDFRKYFRKRVDLDLVKFYGTSKIDQLEKH